MGRGTIEAYQILPNLIEVPFRLDKLGEPDVMCDLLYIVSPIYYCSEMDIFKAN